MPALFDTLEYAQRLGEGGFTEQQSQAAAKALSGVLAEDVATKADVDAAAEIVRSQLEALRLQLEAKLEVLRLQLEAKLEASRLQIDSRFETIRLEVNAKISDAKFETIRWMIGITGFQFLGLIGALFGLIKFVK